MQAFRRSLYNAPRYSTTLRIQTYNGTRRHFAYSSIRMAANSEPNNAAEPVVDPKGKQKEVSTPVDNVAEKIVGDDELPFLSRPLGVKEPPITTPMTWREEMMDQDVRMQHRQKLVKEATRGYFSDLNATRKQGGKTWIAPRVLIRENKALYFPDIMGTNLYSEKVHTTDLLKGKVTVLSILSSKISEIQTQMFTESTNQKHSSHPRYQFMQINLQENKLKSLLVSLFTSSIRKTISPDLWRHYLVSSQNMDYVRDDLGITNKHVAYIFLVDEKCKIRWAGCADPKPEEVHALSVCTDVLLKRGSSSSPESAGAASP